MNIKKKVSSRFTELCARRNDESGEGLIVMIMIMVVFMLMITTAMLAWDMVMNAKREFAIAEESSLSYQAIYDDYLEKAQGIDDEEKLKDLLNEATKDYEALKNDKDLQITSALVDHNTITVTVSREYSNTEKTYVATADKDSTTESEPEPIGSNDILDLEGALAFE